jgi:hypothetical protein
MIRGHFAWRDQYGWGRDVDLPGVNDINMVFFEGGSSFEPIGLYDKFGRMVAYRFAANMDNKWAYSIDNLRGLVLWAFYWRAKGETFVRGRFLPKFLSYMIALNLLVKRWCLGLKKKVIFAFVLG